MINALVLAHVAPQGFRPGLRTNAPIRGLKASLQQAGLAGQNAALFLDRFLWARPQVMAAL